MTNVLTVIHASDGAAIRPLMTATNYCENSDDDPVGLFRESKVTIGDVKRVTELGRHWHKWFMAAKIRVVGDEPVVVVLRHEDGKFLFDDLNSPSVE